MYRVSLRCSALGDISNNACFTAVWKIHNAKRAIGKANSNTPPTVWPNPPDGAIRRKYSKSGASVPISSADNGNCSLRKGSAAAAWAAVNGTRPLCTHRGCGPTSTGTALSKALRVREAAPPCLILQAGFEHLRAALATVAARRTIVVHRCLRDVDHPAAVRARCMQFVDQVGERRSGVDGVSSVQRRTSRNAHWPGLYAHRFSAVNGRHGAKVFGHEKLCWSGLRHK